MPESPPTDYRDLLELLSREVGEWEHSPYYLPQEELFDLERFLSDHRALEQAAAHALADPYRGGQWITLSLDPTGLFVGDYHDTVIIAAADATTEPVRVPVREGDGYQLDPAAVKRAISEGSPWPKVVK